MIGDANDVAVAENAILTCLDCGGEIEEGLARLYSLSCHNCPNTQFAVMLPRDHHQASFGMMCA